MSRRALFRRLAEADAHLLDSREVLPQLELLLLRAPAELRIVLATRHGLRLGLHRLRLEGELTEVCAADLRFSLAEARALFGGAGVELPADALARLHARTEGWAAGLRLAMLSLAGAPPWSSCWPGSRAGSWRPARSSPPCRWPAI